MTLQDFHAGELSVTDIAHIPHLPVGGSGHFLEGPQVNPSFTCFTSTKVHKLTLMRLGPGGSAARSLRQFTSTKEQKLTLMRLGLGGSTARSLRHF